MKLVSYSSSLNDDIRIGVVLEGQSLILDLLLAAQSLSLEVKSEFNSMLDLIGSGEAGLEHAKLCLASAPAGAIVAADSVKFHAPIPVPPQMRDFIVFEKHFKQAIRSTIKLGAIASGKDPEQAYQQAQAAGRAKIPPIWYERPIYYKTNRFAVTGQDETVDWPSYSSVMDYECELACVIGRGGRDIIAENATDHIFGYMIFNDLTARDAQGAEMPGMMGPAKGKDFDKANPMGPYLVTRDEITNASGLEMIVRINGEQKSKGSSSTMHWSFEQMIATVSAGETLHSGEILCSGTVGDGCGFERLEFLNSGDTIELEISGLGVLTTTVRSHPTGEKNK